jgi:hypothetical protein
LIKPRGITVLRSFGARAMPYSVNNNSVVVGWSDDEDACYCRPAIWREGTPALLPDMGFGGVALQINDQEHVVGQVRVSHDGPMAAARWRGGSLELFQAFEPYNSASGSDELALFRAEVAKLAAAVESVSGDRDRARSA